MKRLLLSALVLFCITPLLIFPQNRNSKEFLPGADILIRENLPLIKGKQIGVVTNHTALLKNGTLLADSLAHIPGINIKALFSPEHGIRGNEEAGAGVKDGRDPVTGIRVISLYGKNYKPRHEDLEGIDLLLFDIQDIGARYFTYISTLYYTIESCAENKLPLIVLDRPNPVAPLKTDGPVTENKFRSFIAVAPIPVIHGMTVGELALLFNSIIEKEKGVKCEIKVVKMSNWNRKHFLDYYSPFWVKPSPNMASLETTVIYGGTCLIEGTNVSEGRGTSAPFLTIGAPFINSAMLIKELQKEKIEGVRFLPAEFTPADIPGTATNPKYKNELCRGISIKITDRNKVEPLKLGVKLIYALKKLYPQFGFKDRTIDNLFGASYLREMINKGEKPEKIFLRWQKELNNFINLKKKFLLY